MKREDLRDEALGALLRRAAETAAEGSERVRKRGMPGPAAAYAEGRTPRRFESRRVRAWIAGGAALAAGLVAALTFPALAGRRAQQVLLIETAGHLSRSLIRESSSFLAELPETSYLESAAADWAGSLFPMDIDL